MKNLFYCSLFALAIANISCKNTERIATQFDNPPTLSPLDSLGTDRIMRPVNFFAFDDKVAIQTLEDSVFVVYGLPKFDYLYSFGKKGTGPGEFNAAVSNICSSSNSVSVRNYGSPNRRLSIYKVGKDKMDELFKGDDYGFDLNYSSVYQVIDDSLLVASFISPESSREHSLKLLSLKNGVIKDIAKNFYTYTIPFNDRPNISRNEAFVTAQDRNIAIAYQESEHIDIYRIDRNDSFVHITTIGSPIKKSEIDPDPASVKMSYIRILSDKDHIYAVNACTSVCELSQSRQINIKVEIYKWNGERVSAFKLDRPNVLPIFVSKKEKALYAFNPREDFEKIYKYRLPVK